jgi:hypothetical protein
MSNSELLSSSMKEINAEYGDKLVVFATHGEFAINIDNDNENMDYVVYLNAEQAKQLYNELALFIGPQV